MEFKKDDFVRVRTFEDRFFLALRADFFDKAPIEEEAIEELEVDLAAEEEAKRLAEEEKKRKKA